MFIEIVGSQRVFKFNFKMMKPIQLNDQTFFPATEISNKWPEGKLSIKPMAI